MKKSQLRIHFSKKNHYGDSEKVNIKLGGTDQSELSVPLNFYIFGVKSPGRGDFVLTKAKPKYFINGIKNPKYARNLSESNAKILKKMLTLQNSSF